MTWNIKAEWNLQTESGRSVIFDGAYETYLITARTWGGSEVCKYYYTYRTDGPFPIEVWVWDNNWDASSKFRYIFARECNGQYPEWRVSGTSTAGYPTLSEPAIIGSGPPDYPDPTISASEYETEIDLGETDWVRFTVTNDGTEYTDWWGIQVRVGNGLELVEHSSYPWNQGNMCDGKAAEWYKENDLGVGASDYIWVGIRGTTVSDYESVWFTAWMHDPDEQPEWIQYSHPYYGEPCNREYAEYGIRVTCPTPGMPSLVSPGNGESGVSTTPVLDWSDVSGATSYDTQVCSDSGCTSVVRSATDVGSSQWAVSPALSTGTQYWWRARAKNSCGLGSWSSTRSFTTQVSPNTPPNPPSNPSPPNHATSIPISADLSWTGGDPDADDTVTYDVYFGTSSSPPLVSNDQSGTIYDPGTLAYSTKYYWKVVATDNHGAATGGPLWDFTTESAGPGEWKSPSATGDQFNEWVNPENAYSSDNQYADCGLTEPQHAYQDYYNFDFGIPPNVIIQGIEVRCEGHTTDTGQMWWILRLSGDGGSTWSAYRDSPDVNLNTDTTVYIGGSSDLWGESWTPSSFSNANFRLWICPLSLPWPPADAHHLDHIQVKVYYTVNNPPDPPSNPSPPNDEPNASINADLSWSGGDPDPGDTVTYDVYFGTSSSPPLVSDDQSGTIYHPGTLAYSTKYYWKVMATDNHGATTEGPLWDFTTGGGCEVDIFVVLQGGSRPPEAWEVPITIKFFEPGADVITDDTIYEFDLTTTESDGTAACQCVGVMPGTYDITAQASNHPECIEGNCTLMNAKRSVVISAPSTAVDMGTLLAGDANCDGIINISDFGVLAVAYMCTEGQPCYDCRADFDCNGMINISDFGLLAVDYMKSSPVDLS
jgi:hypothetical protein